MKTKTKVFVLLTLAGTTCVLAQEKGNVTYRTEGPVIAGATGPIEFSHTPVVGAPYTATTNNESVQVLADGNRIVQTSTGMTARDSQGRTRHDAELPAIGNLAATNAPHLVFIQDPITQTSYTLNLTEKTAHKMSMGAGEKLLFEMRDKASTAGSGEKVFVQMSDKAATAGSAEATAIPLPKIAAMDAQKAMTEHAQINTEDLGTQTMEGVVVTGVRTTRTIAAGQIGNEKPIAIVTEIWTSPELKTVVMSKRSDPRMGEQTFRLTNIVRVEPDASWFTVPADFSIADSSQPIVYRPNR
jgi:hypothetical protein